MKKNLLVVLSTIVLSFFIFNLNVKALDSDVLNSITDTLEVNISSNDASLEDFNQKIEALLANQITEDMGSAYFITYFEDIDGLDIYDIHILNIEVIQNGNVVASKQVNIVYTDDSNINEEDKTALLNLIKKDKANLDNINFEYDFTRNIDEAIDNQIPSILGDDSITAKHYITKGTAWEDGKYYASEVFTVFKNDVAYYQIRGRVDAVYAITIPASLGHSDEDISKYVVPLILNSGIISDFSDGLTLSKSDTDGVYKVIFDGGAYDTIIIRREKGDEVKLQDTKSGIKLDTDSSVIDANVVLKVETNIAKEKLDVIKESLKDISTKYTVCDITLLLDGAAIQPNGKVKISMPIPEGYDKGKLSVYRIDNDGTYTKYDVTIEGDYAIFETDHFSDYVLVENNIIQKTNNVQTSSINVVFYGIVSLITFIGAICLLKGKKNG